MLISEDMQSFGDTRSVDTLLGGIKILGLRRRPNIGEKTFVNVLDTQARRASIVTSWIIASVALLAFPEDCKSASWTIRLCLKLSLSALRLH